MDYTGSNVKLDFEDTWRVGREYLPNMATTYAGANRKLSEVNISGAEDFTFVAEWTALHDLMQTIFMNSSKNLEDTASALRTALEDYVEKDGDNSMALALSEAKDEVGDGEPYIPQTRDVG